MAQNTPAPAAGQKPKKVKKSATSGMSRALVRRETTSAYLFLLPSLIFFVTFVVVPMFICVYYSFTDYGLGGVKGFAGLSNYIKLFQDPIFHRGFLNTVLMVVVAVPSVTAFSLWVSSAIYKMHSIPRSFFRCVFYLPVVTGSVAITVVWKWILTPTTASSIRWPAPPALTGWAIQNRHLVYHPDPVHHLHRSAHRAVCGGSGQCGQLHYRGSRGGRRHQVSGVLEDQMALHHAHYPVCAGHHHHQHLPVLR